ncbi:antibiotic biosynthesis monooxygenase [Herbiconiux sp.]|uniref:putative quinol monooxygenase n=1 Tax=Herbiconiux sp. TaxID=1871186 RepID=UPI0025C6EB1C|nr:antibiotic biosynthesis monooxygenase [Herbiconiux sp.]
MLVITGGVAVSPDEVAAITAAAATFAAECRQESGNIDYRLSWDISEPNRIVLHEAWDDVPSYDLHTTQPHVAAWTTRIAAASLAAPAFTKYDSTPHTP